VTSFALRLDLQLPPGDAAERSARYAAALDIAEQADAAGFEAVILHEHHGAESGYLPSALTMAAAIASRTRSVRIRVSALVAALHDPVRVAEQSAVVDLLSGGRLELVIVNGYVAEEFAAAGVKTTERVARAVEMVETLRQAWTGEPFEFRGRRVRVTPRPIGDGPRLLLGGATEAPARRAARLGVGFRPQVPSAWAHYRDELRALGGADPGPPESGFGFVHVAVDPETAWARLLPHLEADVAQYARWLPADASTPSRSPAETVQAMRDSGAYRVLTPEQLTEALRAEPPATVVSLHPFVGGLPVADGRECVQLVAERVIPAVRAVANVR
jgi:alkanesulfonate monooxygenase SsuD/methylene tetrahydromethanopterin reductase-like flavin-dependent oxidoreductase (luciferase family)